MANEPERPVEKWLRRSAQKRREEAGAPFELHPATRRLFQGEVARHFPSGGGLQSRSFWSLFWPRLAVAALGVLMLSLLVFTVLPSRRTKEQTLLARNEAPQNPPETPLAAPLKQEKAKEFAPVAPVPVPAPTLAANDSAQRRLAAAPTVAAPYSGISKDSTNQVVVLGLESSGAVAASTEREGVAPAGGLAGAAPSPPGDKALPSGQVFAGGVARPQPAEDAKALVRSAPADQAMTLSDSRAEMSKETYRFAAGWNGRASQGQDFVRAKNEETTTDQLSEAAPSAAVLASFKLEQAGNQLRVIDQDGSVYSGTLQTAIRQDLTADRKRGVLMAPPASSAPTTTTPVPKGYFFELTGTNRTLNQKVIFTGTLMQTNPLPTNLGAVSRRGGTARAAIPTAALSISRLSGKMQIGDSQPVEINAVPAKP